MTHLEIGALDDCRELNVEYLETISTKLKMAESFSNELVERITSFLSGIVTNQQTCWDELVETKSGVVNAIYAPMSNGTKLYSVSLGLVTHSLNQKLKHKRKEGSESHQGRGSTTSAVREPLETLIKALRKSSCESLSSCSRRRERRLADLEGNGILINDTVIVSSSGADNFTSIGDAVAFAPNNTIPEAGYFVIYVREAVSGERFLAVDVTFRNTAGPEKHQAVDVRNNADISTFYRCSFEGYQDTLYVHSLRQFYRDCHIYGTVDFIFGNAAAMFQSCHLYARKPLANQKNAFTAQGRTDPNQNTGISIHNCTIEAAPDLAMDLNSTFSYLGRPWKLYSRTVYMQSYIDKVISPVGWLEWNGTVGLDTLYYGEFQNYGPGANTSMRMRWPGYTLMNATQAMNFTVYNFTMGDTWLPQTDIPFSGGLLAT
ncbi:hypothetical protein K2173_008854 [Erythroxylum novogranatense]|uniref:Pectinesterase n=1 Tax=Erythroxylum novogranatense TaxID=1862640 RepID=A0AAV8S4V3_9ROSI|nr:hypothetical protein K2173_008854 [Erythroxylum novogranatense]